MIVPYLEAGHGKKRIVPSLTPPLIDRSSFSPTLSFKLPYPVTHTCAPSYFVHPGLALLLSLFYFLFSLTSSLGFLKPVTLTSMSLVLLATDPCFSPSNPVCSLLFAFDPL